MTEIDEELAKVFEYMRKNGVKTGQELMKLAKEMHSDTTIITAIPLYRSCLLIEQTDELRENGQCILHFYHDPEWMGETVTKETLVKYYKKIIVQGQRSGADLLTECEHIEQVLHISVSGLPDILYNIMDEEERGMFFDHTQQQQQ
jgi:hypothetical protein